MTKISLIARYDNSGLGNLSWELARHLKPSKVALIQNHKYQTFPERYADFDARKVEVFDSVFYNWFLSDIDVLWTTETFYNWQIIKEARKRGVKTILYTMYEMTQEKMPLMPSRKTTSHFRHQQSHPRSIFVEKVLSGLPLQVV